MQVLPDLESGQIAGQRLAGGTERFVCDPDADVDEGKLVLKIEITRVDGDGALHILDRLGIAVERLLGLSARHQYLAGIVLRPPKIAIRDRVVWLADNNCFAEVEGLLEIIHRLVDVALLLPYHPDMLRLVGDSALPSDLVRVLCREGSVQLKRLLI